MRNLKKVLTLVLTLAMLLSVMVVGAGAATFGDQDSITNDEAVDMCVALNIIGGYEDGTFRPTGNVTRAEMSKMICVALNGGKEPTMGSGLIGTFNDVATSDWSAPYVEYCVSQGIVGGVGGGRFNPNGNITGTQAAKMLLCILGYNASIQGYVGNDYWETKINVDAAQKGLYEGLSNIDASAPLTRDQAAQMIWNALNAYEVEYVTTLVTGPNGELTSKVTVQDRYDSNLDSKITLLGDKYEAEIETAYMTNVSYDSVKGEYTYDLTKSASFNGGTISGDDAFSINGGTGKLTTAQDFSDLFGMKVGVVYKTDTNKTVYGIYAKSSVLASDIVGNVTDNNGNDVAATNNQIKISDVRYHMNDTVADANVYVYNVATSSNNLTYYTDAGDAQGYQSFDAIDHDGDGEIDCFIIYPVSPQDVTYVGTSSINAGGSYTKDEDTGLYDNGDGEDYNFPSVSKEQWVAIDQYNVKKIARDVAVLETVQGEVTAMRGTDIQIDGTWYKEAADNGDNPTVGDTAALTVIGNYYFDAEIIDGKSLDNVLMILEAGNNSSGIGSGVEARVMYAKDGSVGTISKISKVDGGAATVPMNGMSPEASPSADTHYTGNNVVVGAMYTYKEKDGAIELTMINSTTNQISDWTFAKSSSAFTEKTSSANAMVNGVVISDDAVVMSYDKTSDKYSFITGATLKTWKADFGDTAQYLVDTINGVPTVVAVALYANNTALPGVSGTTGYGYVTASARHISENDTDYAVLTIWTADGELKDVKAEGITSSSVTPNDTNVRNHAALQKGAFVTFEKLSNGNIDEIDVVGNTDAMYGVHTNRDGDNDLYLGSGTSMVATKDTQVIYVNTKNETGATGDGDLTKSLAQETEADDVYFPNVKVVGPNGDGEADAIFIDVNNRIEGAAISTGTLGKINNALLSGDVTSSVTTINSAITVPADRTLTLTGAANLSGGTISVAATGTLKVTAACTNAGTTITGAAAGAKVVIGASPAALDSATNFFATPTATNNGAPTGSAPDADSTYVWTVWEYTDSGDGNATKSTSGWVKQTS